MAVYVLQNYSFYSRLTNEIIIINYSFRGDRSSLARSLVATPAFVRFSKIFDSV